METSRAPGVGLAHGAACPGRDFGHLLLSGSGSRGGEGGGAAGSPPNVHRASVVARSTVNDGRRNRAYFQAVYFQTSGGGEAPHPWTMGSRLSVGAGQLAGTRGAVQIDAGGEGGREQAVHY